MTREDAMKKAQALAKDSPIAMCVVVEAEYHVATQEKAEEQQQLIVAIFNPGGKKK